MGPGQGAGGTRALSIPSNRSDHRTLYIPRLSLRAATRAMGRTVGSLGMSGLAASCEKHRQTGGDGGIRTLDTAFDRITV
jgi:hypothetical protein